MNTNPVCICEPHGKLMSENPQCQLHGDNAPPGYAYHPDDTDELSKAFFRGVEHGIQQMTTPTSPPEPAQEAETPKTNAVSTDSAIALEGDGWALEVLCAARTRLEVERIINSDGGRDLCQLWGAFILFASDLERELTFAIESLRYEQIAHENTKARGAEDRAIQEWIEASKNTDIIHTKQGPWVVLPADGAELGRGDTFTSAILAAMKSDATPQSAPQPGN